MNKLGEIRWVFDISKWKPSRSEWTVALGCLPDEERQRISKFWFKRDAKASMAGQLMLRKLIRETLEVEDGCFQLQRTDRGKPYLAHPPNFPLNFNVSHQGSYTALAASPCKWVGIDVMRVDTERFAMPNCSAKIDDFFHTMRRQFTTGEWANIRVGSLEDQLLRFYRHWCLKESYVKAVGTGIAVDLQKIDFQVMHHNLEEAVASTTVKIDGFPADDWCFEEQLLDDRHCVCVALNPAFGQKESVARFQSIEASDLISENTPLSPVDPQWAVQFDAKEEEPQYPWNQ